MRDKFAFRVRGREVSRVEAFSDVVFGFALTLIVVSLEVPQTYAELMKIMRGLPVFAICFATLMWIWFEHHKFFQRYDMKDPVTIVLNAVLLFQVLFYTYPLKFIFAVATRTIPYRDGGGPKLLVLYGFGFVSIFALLFVMYHRAYRKRVELRLNEFEVYDTVTSLLLYAAYVGIGLLSAVLALILPLNLLAFSGWTYFLLGPVSGVIGWRRGRQREALQSRHVQTAQTTPKSSESMAVPTVAANGP